MTAPNMTMKDHRSLFRQFLAGTYDAVLISDPSGHLLEVNPRATEYFGYAPEELDDRNVGVLIPGVTPAMIQRIRKGLDESRHMMLDANCRRKDGSMFSAEVTVSVIDLLNIGDLVFTVRNTERRSSQLRMLRTKENAFASTLAASFACAPDGAFRYVNASFCDMFDIQEEEALKLKFADIFDDDPLPERFNDAAEGDTVTLRLDVPSDDGEEALEIRLAPDRQGKKIIGVVGSVVRA